jgi:hypothetical protein
MSKTLGQLQVFLSKTPAGAGIDPLVLKGYINARLREILDRNDWLRLIKTGIIQTIAPYVTGTVALTNGSNAVTGTGTTFTASMTGRRFRVSGRNETYTFTYVSATSGTLDRVFEGDTDTGLGYRIFKAVYSLPADVDRVESVFVPSMRRDLNLRGREWLDAHFGGREFYGAPEFFTLTDDSSDASPLVQIELYPIPEIAEGLPIRYRVLVADLSATSDILPVWISPNAIIYGVESDLLALTKDYAGAAFKQQAFEQAVAGMLRQDAMQTGAEAIATHPRYTNHRYGRLDDSYDSDFAEFARQNTRNV